MATLRQIIESHTLPVTIRSAHSLFKDRPFKVIKQDGTTALVKMSEGQEFHILIDADMCSDYEKAD